MTTPPAKLDIVHAYRRLYRSLLSAVSHATPARYVVRDHLRAAFREPPPPTVSTVAAPAAGAGSKAANSAAAATAPQWNPEAIKRTIWFCEAAAKERGIEHRILRNLVRVKLSQYRDIRRWKKVYLESQAKDSYKKRDTDVYHHYNMTVAMLNKSMGLCLR